MSVVIVDALRVGMSPVGGVFSRLRIENLAGQLLDGLCRRNGCSVKDLGHLVLGCGVQEREQGNNIARQVLAVQGAQEVGAEKVGGVSLNRLDLSGFDALAYGEALCSMGHGLVVAGACEKMSISERGFGQKCFHPELVDKETLESWSAFTRAQQVVATTGVKNGDVDAYVLEMHQRACAAQDQDRFKGEIQPVAYSGDVWKDEQWKTIHFKLSSDENPKEHLHPEQLAKLPSLTERRRVSPAHFPTPSDGSGMLLMCSEIVAKGRGLKPMGKVLKIDFRAVDSSTLMAESIVRHVDDVLGALGISHRDCFLVQSCESSAQVGHFFKKHWQGDSSSLNRDGSALSLGNGMAATSMTWMVHLLHSLKNSEGRYGVLWQDGALGQSCVVVVEKC